MSDEIFFLLQLLIYLALRHGRPQEVSHHSMDEKSSKHTALTYVFTIGNPEPFQVFELLETLYGSFDQLAKRRRIFKVETIG
jgi:Adenylate and Guanylate cyclase catalytic domain